MGTNYIAPIWRMPRNLNNVDNRLSNYSVDFNGTNEYIDCGNSSNVDITGALSISFWIKAPNQTQYRGIISKAVANTASIVSQSQYHIEVSGTTSKSIRFVVTGVDLKVGTETTGTVPSLDFDQWQHIVMTWNGTNEMIVYNNGTQAATKTQSSTITSLTDNLFIGKRNRASGEFEGQIAQVCIFNYALNSTQVTYLYNLNNPMAISGGEPVAYYPLGDNSNPNAPGSFPNISVGADSVFDFNASEYIDVPDSNSLSFGNSVSDSPFSMSAWIKTTNGSGKGIISKWGNTGTTGYEWLFWLVGPNKVRLNLLDGINTVYQTTQGNTSVNTGEWVHVVATYDGRGGDGSTGNTANQGIKIYVNGVEDTPYSYLNNGAYTAMHNTARQVQIGAYNSVGQFDGEISNAEIWGTELTAAEVTTLYNNGQPLMTGTQPEETNLKAWWKLNQSANWEAITANTWQIPDNRSAYPQSFDFPSLTSGDYIDTSYNLDGLTSFTVSAWFNTDNVTGNPVPIVSTRTGAISASKGLDIYIAASNLYWRVYNNGATQILQSFTNTTDWQHVVLTYDGSTLTAYLNGSLVNSATGSYVTSNANMLIGKWNNGANYFDGQISNVQVYDTALPETGTNSVQTLYNNGVPLTTAIASDNLKGWYKLDNNEIWDGTKWEVENQKYPANYENALNFGTRSQAEYIALNQLPLYNAITVSAWIKTQKNGSTKQTIISNSQPNAVANEKGWQLAIDQGWSSGYTKAGFVFFDSTGSTAITIAQTSSQDLTDNKWHHVVALWDGTTNTNAAKIFVDGLLAGQGTSSFTGPIGQPVIGLEPRIGSQAYSASASGGGNYFGGDGGEDGFISNIQTWDSSLTYGTVSSIGDIAGGQIADLYNNGTPVTTVIDETNLQCWYKLDNLTTGIKDLSNNSNDGTNNGTSQTSTFVSTQTGASTDMTEQNLVNNNVSALNGESVGMNTTNLVQSNLTRTQPYSDYSINFDANSLDYIQVANPGNIIGYGESAYTFSGWVNFDAIGNQDGIFGRYQDSSNRVTIKTGITSPYNGIVLQIQNGASNGYSEWTNIITTGQWYHICAVYDGSQGTQSNRLKLYFNGVNAGNRNNGSGTIPATTTNMTASTPLDIGNDRRISGRVLDGKVSNYCVFDRILTDDEILKIYNNGITQDLQATSSFSNNILAWWPMDASNSYYDGTNWTVRDLEGGKDGDGVNTGNVVGDMTGTAPGSEGSGLGVNLAIEDLQGNMYNSDKNAYSINMADYADGVTNPANSGRSTDTP